VQTRAYLNYLKPSMGIWLLVAAAVLVVVGAAATIRALLGREHAHHELGHPMTRAAWLLVLPVLAVIALPTDPLGAFAAGRLDTRRPDATTRTEFGPLPAPVDGAIDLSLREFVDRAFLDEERSLEGERVRLTGFVVPAQSDESFVLSRFVIMCCAADAYPVEVAVHGAEAPPIDSWVTLTGKWRRPEGRVRPYVDLVEIDADETRIIERPDNPYDPA
jgi:uncharacterized repeat protein (TIGR03943 family)